MTKEEPFFFWNCFCFSWRTARVGERSRHCLFARQSECVCFCLWSVSFSRALFTVGSRFEQRGSNAGSAKQQNDIMNFVDNVFFLRQLIREKIEESLNTKTQQFMDLMHIMKNWSTTKTSTRKTKKVCCALCVCVCVFISIVGEFGIVVVVGVGVVVVVRNELFVVLLIGRAASTMTTTKENERILSPFFFRVSLTFLEEQSWRRFQQRLCEQRCQISEKNPLTNKQTNHTGSKRLFQVLFLLFKTFDFLFGRLWRMSIVLACANACETILTSSSSLYFLASDLYLSSLTRKIITRARTSRTAVARATNLSLSADDDDDDDLDLLSFAFSFSFSLSFLSDSFSFCNCFTYKKEERRKKRSHFFLSGAVAFDAPLTSFL